MSRESINHLKSIDLRVRKETEVLNRRQRELLKIIVEGYINEKIAISSLNIKSRNFYKWSSATIRNEMLILENKGFLRKEHQSSGRIPTKEGYKFYIGSLMQNLKSMDPEIKSKLIELFSDRNRSIDLTLDRSAEIISNFLNLPIVLSRVRNFNQEILRKLDLVELSENEFMILAITSSGEIYKDKIFVEEFKEREDLHICINLLNEKIIGLELSNIFEHALKLLPEIRKSVHRYEFVYEKIITKICSGVINKCGTVYRIYNKNSIISQPEVQNNQISLEKIFNLLEDHSTFSQINLNYLKTGKTLINLESEVDGISIATTVLNSEKKTHSLSIIGPISMNYQLIKSLFEFINEKLVVSSK